MLSRANRLGGGYQPLEERREEEQEAQQPEITEDTEQESEGESQVTRGDNFPIADLKAYNTEGTAAQIKSLKRLLATKRAPIK